MNEQIKMSIDGRRNAVEAAYELNDAAKTKLDSLFKKIEALGKECKDSADFEAKIASSPLNQEYINLFTEFATTCKSKMATPDTSADMPTAGDVAADLIKTQADLSVDGTIQSARGRAYRAGYDKLRDVPVVGDAIDMKNKIDFFSRFKK